MPEITLSGKTYQAKTVTLATMLREQTILGKMAKYADEENWGEYDKAFVRRLSLYVDGDVSKCLPGAISPEEGIALADFFEKQREGIAPKSESAKETSPDTSPSTAS